MLEIDKENQTARERKRGREREREGGGGYAGEGKRGGGELKRDDKRTHMHFQLSILINF